MVDLFSAPVFFSFIITVWLVVLTGLVLKTVANYNRLTRGVTEKTLSQVLTELLAQSKITEKEYHAIRNEIATIRKDSRRFLQKVSLVRFNPFADTGGDQSFALVMLNEENSGFIMTSLYSRSGARWYIKTIHQGKAVEYKLSKEEEAALAKVV
jgi:hypothetical protein